MDDKTLILDLETTVRNKGDEAVGNFTASPYSMDNFVVAGGIKYFGEDPYTCYIPGEVEVEETMTPLCSDTTLLVGQNIGFDLLYLYRAEKWRKWAKTGAIWDTMIVEYLLSGQKDKFPSLNALAEKYGGSQKDEKIEQYWDDGMDTTDIPHDLLSKYLQQDVLNTEIVFTGQLIEAEKKGMLRLIKDSMLSRMVTIEMEWNGMYFNTSRAKEDIIAIENELSTLRGGISTEIHTLTGIPIDHCNPGSDQQISLAIFGGGPVKIESRVVMMDKDDQPVYYKSGAKKGEVRYKLEKGEYTSGLKHRTSLYRESVKKPGFYKTGDEILERMVRVFTEGRGISIFSSEYHLAAKVQKCRGLQKLLSSFYLPYVDKTWGNGVIHPQYNHAQTATGRLSCSSPNLQQVKNDD